MNSELIYRGSKLTKVGYVILLTLIFSLFSCNERQESHTIFLIGDSTMADYVDNYKSKEEYMREKFPVTGWGQAFSESFAEDSLNNIALFDKGDKIDIENHAHSGRSTRTFFQEGRWRKVYNRLKEGDVVLIQFGHNDAAKDKVEKFVDIEGYEEFLRLFIRDTRAKNATPILLTPVARNYPWKEGELKNVHGDYDLAVKEIAQENNVYLIDLNKESRVVFTKKGEAYTSNNFFMNLPPGKYEAFPEGQNDNTHFQPEGAKVVAEIVFSKLKRIGTAE